MEYMENGNILLEKAVTPGNLEKLFQPVLWRKHLFSKSLHRRKLLLMELLLMKIIKLVKLYLR